MAEIARLQSLGLGLESTPGTAVSASVSIPTDSFNLKHVVEKVNDANSFGVIDEISGSHITKESSELTASGIARSQTLGYLLKLALGTAGTATLVETGVYSHAFTRLNTNAPKTATVYRNSGVADERAPYHVLDTLEIDATVGDYVNFSVTTKGGKIESATYSPSFLTGTNDEPFKASACSVKFASDIAGLAGASATNLTNIKFTISKNAMGIYSLGATTLTSNVNQQLGVTGDFEAIYEANTIRDLFTANTKQAIQITITGDTLIGATQYNKIIIQIAKAQLETWDRSTDNNNIMTHSVGFVAEYDFTNTQTLNISLQNKKATDY